MINGKHGQGTHITKMGADKSAENTPTAPKFICPICLPRPKSLGFWWKKASSGVYSLCLQTFIDLAYSCIIACWVREPSNSREIITYTCFRSFSNSPTHYLGVVHKLCRLKIGDFLVVWSHDLCILFMNHA